MTDPAKRRAEPASGKRRRDRALQTAGRRAARARSPPARRARGARPRTPAPRRERRAGGAAPGFVRHRIRLEGVHFAPMSLTSRLLALALAAGLQRDRKS